MIENGAPRILNTILLSITLAALGFIGTISYNSSIALAELKGAQMTRAEIESKLAEVRTTQASTDKDLQQMKIDIAKLFTRPIDTRP